MSSPYRAAQYRRTAELDPLAIEILRVFGLGIRQTLNNYLSSNLPGSGFPKRLIVYISKLAFPIIRV
jgi:hypothetical protein